MVGKSVSICKASVVPFWMNLAIHLPSSPTLHHLFPHHLVMWGPETPRRKMVLWSHTEKQEYSCPLGFFFTGWCATRSWDYWVQGQADSLARRIAVIKELNQNLFICVPKKGQFAKNVESVSSWTQDSRNTDVFLNLRKKQSSVTKRFQCHEDNTLLPVAIFLGPLLGKETWQLGVHGNSPWLCSQWDACSRWPSARRSTSWCAWNRAFHVQRGRKVWRFGGCARYEGALPLIFICLSSSRKIQANYCFKRLFNFKTSPPPSPLLSRYGFHHGKGVCHVKRKQGNVRQACAGTKNSVQGTAKEVTSQKTEIEWLPLYKILLSTPN